MASPEAIAVIQATLAPAFLMTGGGIFLNFIQARLFRVNDHLRRLAADGRADRTRELTTLALHRGRILRNAIALGVVGLAFIALTMLALLAGVLLGSGPAWLVVVPFGVGLASLTLGLVVGAYDAVLSFRSLVAEFG